MSICVPTPLVSIVLGMLVFRERLRPAARWGLVLSAVGIVYLVVAVGKLPTFLHPLTFVAVPIRTGTQVGQIQQSPQRHQAGENPAPVEYQRRFGITTTNWAEPSPPSDDQLAGAVESGDVACSEVNLRQL